MTNVDILLSLVLCGALLNGLRRGLFREGLIFVMWVPVYVLSIITLVAVHGSGAATAPADAAVATSPAYDAFYTLGGLYMVGAITVWAIDRTVVRPYLNQRHHGLLKFVNATGGAVVGTIRLYLLLLIILVVYGSYVRPIQSTDLPQSVILEQALTDSVPVEDFLRSMGWIKQEKVLYDREDEIRQQQQDKLQGQFKIPQNKLF